MSTTKAAFHKGDWVTFPYGTSDVLAQMVEVYGPIGVNGRRLYRVQTATSADLDADAFDMPETELAPAVRPDPTSIVNYLSEGGLVEILRSNLSGGKSQPRAWLTYSRRGELTHTLLPELGVVGGEIVPFFALHEDKIFVGKRDAVATYLETFGLSSDQASSFFGWHCSVRVPS